MLGVEDNVRDVFANVNTMFWNYGEYLMQLRQMPLVVGIHLFAHISAK